MRLFGRRPGRLPAALLRLPQFLAAAARCAILFRKPWSLLTAYVRRQTPAGRVVQLRDGLIIHLSADPADIVTVFLIFARRDYGPVARGAVVVDIGANIGVFSLFAAHAGASRVIAYEPTAESFDCLQRNISVNGLAGVITAHREAVVGAPRDPVPFPRRSNVFNAIVAAPAAGGEYDVVPAVPLSQVLAAAPAVDILKLDCEGAEYDILLNTADLRNIASIKLEYHQGPRDRLIAKLTEQGFRPLQFMDEGEGGGYLWLTRQPMDRGGAHA